MFANNIEIISDGIKIKKLVKPAKKRKILKTQPYDELEKALLES